MEIKDHSTIRIFGDTRWHLVPISELKEKFAGGVGSEPSGIKAVFKTEFTVPDNTEVPANTTVFFNIPTEGVAMNHFPIVNVNGLLPDNLTFRVFYSEPDISMLYIQNPSSTDMSIPFATFHIAFFEVTL